MDPWPQPEVWRRLPVRHDTLELQDYVLTTVLEALDEMDMHRTEHDAPAKANRDGWYR